MSKKNKKNSKIEQNQSFQTSPCKFKSVEKKIYLQAGAPGLSEAQKI